jgi:hypothetical protein
MDASNDIHIDAATFQKPLKSLAEVLAQKVLREAPVTGPLRVDLHILVRQAMWTYDLLFYLNADERRETDCYWRNGYTIVTMPLVRNMIDCLHNVTLILQDPAVNGLWFRASGFKRIIAAIEEDEQRYGGQPEWDEWNVKRRDNVDLGVRTSGLKMSDVPLASDWPTLGRYAKLPGKGATFTPHQQFLKTFLYGHWRQYSAKAHATFEGLTDIALCYTEDSIPVDERSELEDGYARMRSATIARAATVLLCMITEIQAYFHFDDAGPRIDERIHEMWNALMPSFDVKELYDERYKRLMEDKHIYP